MMNKVEEYINNNDCEVNATGEEAKRIIKLEIRDTAKEAKVYSPHVSSGDEVIDCPSCEETYYIGSWGEFNFCPKCGQRIRIVRDNESEQKEFINNLKSAFSDPSKAEDEKQKLINEMELKVERYIN